MHYVQSFNDGKEKNVNIWEQRTQSQMWMSHEELCLYGSASNAKWGKLLITLSRSRGERGGGECL